MASAATSAPGFRLLEHTADVRLEAWGRDVAEAFVQAARGLTAAIADGRAFGSDAHLAIELGAPSAERLVVRLLNELLFAFETERFLPAGGSLTLAQRPDGSVELTGTLHGHRLTEPEEQQCSEVKAATYHGVAIAEGAEGVRIHVVLDL